MYEPTINYFAVIVATLAHYLLGGLWYSPALFLNQWLDGMGMTREDAKEKKNWWSRNRITLSIFWNTRSRFCYGPHGGFHESSLS